MQTLYNQPQQYHLTLIHVSFKQIINHAYFVSLVGMPKNLQQKIQGN